MLQCRNWHKFGYTDMLKWTEDGNGVFCPECGIGVYNGLNRYRKRRKKNV